MRRMRLPRGFGWDLIGVAGVLCLSYGCWLIYRPAGFIAFGIMLLAGAVLASRSPTPR